MRTYFNKHKYIRVITFNHDKSSTIKYYKKESFNKNKNLLINPDHIFLAKGYTTIVLHDKSAETINPLDFESKYDADMFQSAINTKIIHDTFNTLKAKKFELTQILLIAIAICNVVMLYFLLQLAGLI